MASKEYTAIFIKKDTARKFRVVAKALELTHDELIEKFLKSKVADVKDVLK